MYISIIVVLALLMMIPISSVSATGVRHDSGDDATAEEHECWINGYDSGFAGKYDKDRARECIEHSDNYNKMWTDGCQSAALRTEEECGELINNPVEIEDYEALYDQNKAACRMYGSEDGKADKPYDKERAHGCQEFDGYSEGYQSGCENHTTQASCELQILGEKNYCPSHPDIVACVEFLYNATNKKPAEICYAPGGCFKDQNTEKYCLNYNDSTFCKTVGDICDAGGFVRPEYPYCTNKAINSDDIMENDMPPDGEGVFCDIVKFKVGCYDRNDNPEEFCLRYPEYEVFCNVIDICDENGSVKPEDEYCKVS